MPKSTVSDAEAISRISLPMVLMGTSLLLILGCSAFEAYEPSPESGEIVHEKCFSYTEDEVLEERCWLTFQDCIEDSWWDHVVESDWWHRSVGSTPSSAEKDDVIANMCQRTMYPNHY